ncbi:MAG: L,D-transpeptidase family protein [Candidatus Moranbacteria bacterium]|nr:L,D-transpeptidase family protein [Candidatus Moranbacteria bacterium]
MTFRLLRAFSFIFSVVIGLAMAYASVTGVRFGVQAFGARTVSATTVSSETGDPEQPFLISFSDSVGSSDALSGLSVEPATPFHTEWRDGGKILAVLPETAWESGATYRIGSAGGHVGVRTRVEPFSLGFSVPGYPAVAEVNPSDGASDVLLDIEDPITVRFDRSISDFFADFSITPDIGVTYENDSDKTTFRILPREPLRPDTVYTMTVRVRWRYEADDAFREVTRVSFRTPPAKPVSWAQDVSERVSQVRRYAKAPLPMGKVIDIDLSSQVMTIFENGQLLDAYPVSSGKPGMDTPKGEYVIRNKAPRPWSSAYGLYMPYWMALVPDGKFGIHELPEWPGGYKEGAAHLGRPVSHGCVRLGVGPAERVFAWADIGTPVIVH